MTCSHGIQDTSYKRGEPDWEEIESGRALLPILNRIARLRTCLKSFQPKTAHD